MKVKVQPSLEEYKRRYLENIEKLVLNQTKLVTFSATIITDNTVNEKNEILESKIKKKNIMEENSEISLFTFSFKNGKIEFDVQQAKNLPIDSDLRNSRNLWSGEKCYMLSIFDYEKYILP